MDKTSSLKEWLANSNDFAWKMYKSPWLVLLLVGGGWWKSKFAFETICSNHNWDCCFVQEKTFRRESSPVAIIKHIAVYLIIVFLSQYFYLGNKELECGGVPLWSALLNNLFLGFRFTLLIIKAVSDCKWMLVHGSLFLIQIFVIVALLGEMCAEMEKMRSALSLAMKFL